MASLGHFSLKMSKEPLLQSMASVSVSCSMNFCFQKIKRMIWTTFSFNKYIQIISRNSDVNWPSRSYDLTPLVYFLWGAVKDKCYANHPEMIEALKHVIEVAIHGIEAQAIKNVLRNWVDRMGYCKVSCGSHLNDVVFHS